MSLVDVSTLIDYMSGIVLSEDQQIAAQQVLDGVQQQLEAHINRPLEPVLIRERQLADNGGNIYFSITPVWKIISVMDQGGYPLPIAQALFVSPLTQDQIDAYHASGYDRVVDKLVGTFDGYNPMGFGALPAGAPGQWYVLVYVGGYIGTLTEFAKTAIMRVAAREIQMIHDDAVSIKGGIIRDPEQYGLTQGFTSLELADFDRIRRRVVL